MVVSITGTVLCEWNQKKYR